MGVVGAIEVGLTDKSILAARCAFRYLQDMNDQPNDARVIEEIRALREDVRKHVRNALWVFAAAVALVCLVFGPSMSKDAPVIVFGAAFLLGLAYLISAILKAAINARLRKRDERERFAILSGRTAASRRAP